METKTSQQTLSFFNPPRWFRFVFIAACLGCGIWQGLKPAGIEFYKACWPLMITNIALIVLQQLMIRSFAKGKIGFRPFLVLNALIIVGVSGVLFNKLQHLPFDVQDWWWAQFKAAFGGFVIFVVLWAIIVGLSTLGKVRKIWEDSREDDE